MVEANLAFHKALHVSILIIHSIIVPEGVVELSRLYYYSRKSKRAD